MSDIKEWTILIISVFLICFCLYQLAVVFAINVYTGCDEKADKEWELWLSRHNDSTLKELIKARNRIYGVKK